MRQQGAFKIRRQRAFDPILDRTGRGGRAQRIIDSLRAEILANDAVRNLRIRRVLQSPREIYRLELEVPDLGYQRTTLLDRDALEDLLATDDVRSAVRDSVLDERTSRGVPGAGFEPAWPRPGDFKSPASTRSATRAKGKV